MGENELNSRLVNDPADWIQREFTARRARNPQYSLRAFARFLQVGSGPLSEILLKKRPLTKKMGERIAQRLGLSESEQVLFISLIERAKLPSAEELHASSAEYQKLQDDKFQLIADWYHFAILSLMETVEFRSSIPWIARKLSITNSEVRMALDRLRRLGLVRRERNRWIPTGNWEAAQDVPSSAGRLFHHQSLDQAASALDRIPVNKRDITSITMAIDPDKLPLAKKYIKQFRRRMASLLEEGVQTDVYKLNVQLFPITGDESC